MKREEADNDQLDDLLTRSYEALRRENPRQRVAVLAALTQPVVAQPRAVRPAWPRVVAWAAAACVMATVGFTLLIMPSSTARVYGVENMPSRLNQVATIRVRGTRFVHDKAKPGGPPVGVPFEMAIKRPDKFRFSWLGVGQRADKVEINVGIKICDGRHQLGMSDTKREFLRSPIHPIDARLTTETFAQHTLLTVVMGKASANYKKVDQETYNGRMCDVYEARFDDPEEEWPSTIERLWIDPKSGYPVRLTRDELDTGGARRRESELNDIEVNGPIDDELFAPEAPEGYRDLAAGAAADESQPPALSTAPTASGYGHGHATEVWHQLRISDRALLVTWRRTAPQAAADGRIDWLMDMKFVDTIDRRRVVDHQWLFQSSSAEVWNWSIVAVRDGRLANRAELALELKEELNEATMSLLGLWFADRDLEEILQAIEDAALPEGAPRFTLAEIRARAERLGAEPAKK